MKKFIAILSAVVLSCSMLAGCGAGKGSTQSDSEKGASSLGLTPFEKRQTLKVGYFSGSTHSSPFYIADKMGFFDELNIDVEYESFINGPAMMEANSDWDICSVANPGILNGMKNYDVRMIGICDYENNTAIFARPDSDIAKDPKNPSVWKGKEVILPKGTSLQFALLKYLESIGLTQNDVKITSMDVTSGLTAFKAGQGDVYCGWNALAYTAEDEGFVRITDCGKLGLMNSDGLCATKEALTNKKELIETAWMVYYLTWEWAQSSKENMAKAADYFYESCMDEGVRSSESICERSLEIFKCPSPADAIKLMTEEEDDIAGLANRKVLKAETALFEILDYFISIGSYKAEDRVNILNNKYVDSSIAISCEAKLKAAGKLK